MGSRSKSPSVGNGCSKPTAKLNSVGEWIAGRAVSDKDGVGSLKIKIVRIKTKSNDSVRPSADKHSKTQAASPSDENFNRSKIKQVQESVAKKVVKDKQDVPCDLPNKRSKTGISGNSSVKAEYYAKENSCLKNFPSKPAQVIPSAEKKESPLEKAKRLLAASREAEKNSASNSNGPKTVATLKPPPSRKRSVDNPSALFDQVKSSSELPSNSGSGWNSLGRQEVDVVNFSPSTSPVAKSASPPSSALDEKALISNQKNSRSKSIDTDDEIDIMGEDSLPQNSETGEHTERLGPPTSKENNEEQIRHRANKTFDQDRKSSPVQARSSASQAQDADNSGIDRGNFNLETDVQGSCQRSDGKFGKSRNYRNQKSFKRNNGGVDKEGQCAHANGSNYRNSLEKRKHENYSDSMIFVGDLPPFCSNKSLGECFAQYATVVKARVIDHQCYGFVTFSDRKSAEEIISMFDHGHIFLVSNSQVRVSWAHGSLPEWKVGTGGFVVSKDGNKVHEVNRMATAKEKTMAAAAAAAATAAQVIAGNGPQVSHQQSFTGRERHIVAYNDLL